MSEQEDLLSGMIFYQNHDYLNALKHFNRNADNQTNEVTEMVFQGLSAIANMQLCNYNQASQQFNDLRVRISSWERNQPESGRVSEIQLLKVKVLANLIIIHLLNGMEIRDGLLEELMETIEARYDSNHQAGRALLSALLRSLLGFESFSQLQRQIQQTLQEIQKSERSKSKILRQNKVSSISPIFLSSLSVYSHLKGNVKVAITLQQTSLSLTKGNNTVAAVLSLRHLQRLYEQTSNDKMKRNSRQQLMSLMSNDQFEGVAEETLFRNYNFKIQAAQFLIQELANKQDQFNEQKQEDSNQISFVAVSWKMKRMRNGTNFEKINATLQMLQKDRSIIHVLGQSQFIRQALAEYCQCVENIKEVIDNLSSNYFRRQFLLRLQSIPTKEKPKRIIDIDLVDYRQNDRNQKQYISNRTEKVHTPNRMKKHTFETSLYIVDKNKIVKTQSEFQQENGMSLNSSRLSARPSIALMNKNQQKNQVYLNDRQKQKGVFKISKEDSKKSGVKQQQKVFLRSQKVQRSKSRNQTEVKPKNTIQQFMKTQIMASNPKPKQEKSNLPTKQENIKTSNLLLKQQESERQRQRAAQKPSQPTKQKLIENKVQILIQKPIQIPKQSQISVRQPEPNNSLPKVSQLISKTFEFVPLKSSISEKQKPSGKSMSRQKFHEWLHKIVKRCQFGQYIQKRHLTSDGGDERYFKINTKKEYISLSQKKDSDDNQKQYKFSSVKGIVVGKVTPNMIKECNHKLQPWRCISFILQNRTLDLYCNDFSDMKFIVPGVSLFLKELSLKSESYYVKKLSASKIERNPRGQFQFNHKLIKRHYSLGRLLWKKFLLRLQWQHQKGKKKEKRNPYFCSGAYAIVAAAVKKCNYWPTVMKRKIV